ncbi:hypothetical protein [Marinobacterium lutimaris]|uniref:Uncharacterized protein n=1 Tax=Marinobacterium lutimaris TaxID=568106 RepID=A0A1H5XJZ0_9GAMM|nr:hypothetical protein [Marinobacterium lutimaris]SEG12042.1 hypothetical protein SAMN05444390_1011413 [Marinobacterium lutimaris]
MAILDTDIKLMASERLADTEDGGGMMSAVVIEDGVVNNLFPDISRLDRTYGRVNLRKAFAAVRTANQDMYYGSHAILTDAPDDPRVSVVMFTTGSYTDERTQAQDRIESYVVRGPESPYVLLGDQLEGQRMLRLYSRLDAKLPEVGQVYLLREEDSSGDLTGNEQYVRIDSIEHGEQEFEDNAGVFTRRVYTLEIGTPLLYTFPGPQTASRYSAHGSPTLLRSTQVADASRYYGIVKLQEAIAPGDMTVKAETIYGQLVPSATVESPVVDVQAGVDRANIVAAGPAYSVSVTIANSSASFGRPVVRGSTTFGDYTDDGAGVMRDSGGTQRGLIDYETGLITGLSITGTRTFTATPAVAIYDTALTGSTLIELANRGYNYVKTLSPIPAPGTLFVDYMVDGEWYRMQDGGQGVLVDEYGGTGTINYATGSVVATLGGLPDVPSRVIYSWTTPVHYEIRTTDPDSEMPYLVFTVAQGEILPNSLTLTYDVDGTTKTITDDGAGNLQGDGTGRVIYGIGEVGLQPSVVPDSGAILQISYDTGGSEQETVSHSISGNDASFTVANAPIKVGTFVAEFDTTYTTDTTALEGIAGTRADDTGSSSARVTDNGNGTLSNGGTINYATGAVTMPVTWIEYIERAGWVYPEGGYDERDLPRTFTLNGSIAVRYTQDSVTPTAQSESAAIPNISVNLTPSTTRQIVPGSLEFVWNGLTIIDREGTLYAGWNRQTGAATAMGSINYATGVAQFDSYQGGGSNAITIKTLLTKMGAWLAYDLYFRTPGAPLRPASFYLRATRIDGVVVTGTPDGQGVISNADMSGSIDYETGVVDVRFGQFVLDSALTAAQKSQLWYDANDIEEDGTIWVPAPVDPGTMKFNAVVYSNMPLDASILGLDPVRLPIDGRVPIIRSGMVVVIHSTKTETLSNPLAANDTETLAFDKLASCVLEDQTGALVDGALYTVNRETGAVTMADPLDLSGYTQPLVARYRIEDMALVNEAQINGQLSLVGAIGRAYEPADTWISSALIFGDLGSRVHHMFSQATWTGTWSDARIGSTTTAQYNDLLYPIQVDNQNAIRERWAIIFTGSTTFNVVGETSGQIATGNTGTDCAPVNPVTGAPYFTILAAGWGSGWATNYVMRFNTDAAHAPIWIARTTVSGTPTTEDDSFKLQIRGDAG